MMREATVETIMGGEPRTPYLTRVTLGQLKLHIFWRGDGDDPHDHPADFWTFPLVGYYEAYLTPAGDDLAQRFVKPFRLHFRKAEHAHSVIGPSALDGAPSRRPIVTITFWGKKRRDWGFWVRAGEASLAGAPRRKWVPWKEYIPEPHL